MFFNCQNAPSSSLVGCCNISSWTGFVDFLAFLNLDAENPSRLLETVSQRFSCYLDAEEPSRLCPGDYKWIGCSLWTPELAHQRICILLRYSFFLHVFPLMLFTFVLNHVQIWRCLWTCHRGNSLQASGQWH